jgi:hypothetical protein
MKKRAPAMKKGGWKRGHTQKSIANLLRSKRLLDAKLRASLADLLDPPKVRRQDTEPIGQARNSLATSQKMRITYYLFHSQNVGGVALKDAIANAAREFRISDDEIRKIWAGHFATQKRR